ncbi:hypothetical protein CWE09_10845 [Aliidiomarina minuta]|uniref:Phage infection protein n=1 Tax=Aliidiomarina minuta TaxID=880057 RepID=A0A432W4D3_9GAMM|nr:hypothetical protein [Aliidiomarina minuta]RUO24363.1 hypothetical protein CWE09_10845 [Aliidiomarina minuta]
MFKLTTQLKQLTLVTAIGFTFSAPATLAATGDVDIANDSRIAVQASTGIETAESARELQQLGRGISETARGSAQEARQAMGALVRQEVGANVDAAVNAEVAGQVGASVSENVRNTVRENVRGNVRESVRDDVRPAPVRGRGGN